MANWCGKFFFICVAFIGLLVKKLHRPMTGQNRTRHELQAEIEEKSRRSQEDAV